MFEPGIEYIGTRHVKVSNDLSLAVFWEYGEWFKDELVVILGGGPSHVEFDPKLLKDVSFIAVNSSCRWVRGVAKKTDLLYFNDNSWNERFPELVETWPGVSVTSNRHVKARVGDLVERLDIFALTEFMSRMSDYVQASSGHTAACLAAHMGAKVIVLIGFEAGVVNGRTHGHNDYAQMETNSYENRFVPGWKGLRTRFEELGIKVINSTPNSKILDFPFMPLEEVLVYA